MADEEGDTFFDPSVRPYLHVQGASAFLAYGADPGAGSGFYAMVWRISDRGRRAVQIAQLDSGDLRHWFTSGIVTERRPAKYATDDMLRAVPALETSHRYDDKEFVARYRFDPKRGRFTFLGAKAVPYNPDAPYGVRLPRR